MRYAFMLMAEATAKDILAHHFGPLYIERLNRTKYISILDGSTPEKYSSALRR